MSNSVKDKSFQGANRLSYFTSMKKRLVIIALLILSIIFLAKFGCASPQNPMVGGF